MTEPLGRLILYTRKLDEMIAFYSRFFGYEAQHAPGDRIVELRAPEGGVALLLHPAAKGQRAGQSLVKLVFDVKDVAAFRAEAAKAGLVFGPIHQAEGYVFSNAKDPSGNPVQVSSRAWRGTPEA